MTSVADPLAQANSHLPNYTFVESIYQGGRTTVYRAKAKINQQPVVIKVLSQAYPSFNDFVQFRNQYTITQNLSIPGIIRPLCLEPFGNSYALVMEDFGGLSLAQYCRQQSLSLTETLSIGIQLATTLQDLHQHHVIHKDIKPANILIHPGSKQIKLIDFSLASLLPKEIQTIRSPKNLEGTLAYLAPEQTGRMNRAIDYRTDFYALGVTLYELLTGQLPFTSEDPLELIHCHMAQVPIAVDQINSNVPAMVAAIVAKLMAKNAEDRYQSALGFKNDLEKCLIPWKDQGKITEFRLGQQDRSDRFVIPEKLYGRETEVQTLLDAFDRVSQGGSELMLVAGFSGIGKTAVVNEVHKPIVRQRGYFIKGKFDQFNRNIPFSAFVQAFRDLIGQLLSESDTDLKAWKAEILNALGDNAQVMIDLVPELGNILGPQPSVQELSGTAAQNRFNLVFQKFIQVFSRPEHPLVIFADDLQWADSASFNLIQILMAESQTGHLLLLGAYRDNEVFPAHPLMSLLGELKKARASINTITLQSLEIASLNHFVADTLHAQPKEVQPLTELVMQKTQGNPFFVTHFLNVLHQDQLITFDPHAGCWQCDIVQIREAAVTDDVVALMASQLQKLSATTQKVLTLAACIGAQFDLETLAIVSEQSQIDTAIALWEALQRGFILPISQVYKFYQGEESINSESAVNPGYRFLHDRVQQAAYSLITAGQQAATHWHVGQLLLQGGAEVQDDRLFELVNQLNLGQSVISHSAQKRQLARLNLQSAQKAKLSAAYKAVQTYCETGISILSMEAWGTDYDLMYELHYHGSEAAYLSGNFDQAEALYQVVLKQARTTLDQATIYRIQMTQYQFQGRNAEAITIQRKSTQLLGWTIPVEPDDIQKSLNAEIATVTQFLTQKSIASILDLPKLTDANTEEILRILQILFYAAWLDGQPNLALLALAKMTTLSLQYGNSEMSPFGYVGYGLIANIVLKDAEQAYQFGYRAVQLCDQFDNADVRGMTNFLFAADVHSWNRPLRESDQYYENAYKYSMEAGNWLTVSFTMMLSGSDRLTYGKPLEELYPIVQAHTAFLQQIKSLENLDALKVGVLQPVRQLLGLTRSLASFDDEHFSEADYLQKYQDTPYHLAWFYSVKIRHAYLFRQIDSYRDLIPKLEIIANTIPTHAKHPSTVFYVLLMHLALIDKISDEAKQAFHWQSMQPLEDKLDQWQQDCPENISHKCLLIQAEKARLQGQKATAIDCYDQSIAEAQAQGYAYEAALANELAAQFYLNWGKEKVAAGYMQEAYYGYGSWGAKAKVADLETRYPSLLKPILRQTATSDNILSTLVSATPSTVSAHNSKHKSSISVGVNKTLDFAAILKASQLLSGTIQMDELLHQLTQIILQNSGGDRCALILPDEQGEWQVRAIATPEETELCAEPLSHNLHLPTKLIQYVKNTQKVVIVNDLETDLPIIDDFLKQEQPKSLLCLPILNQGHLIGILSLKNNLTSGVFTNERILVLNFLCTQAAISLENARLYIQTQEDQRRLASLLSNLPGMAYSAANDEHWTMHFASEGCFELTGYTSDELTNNRVIDFGRMIHADDAEAVGIEVEAALSENRPYRVVYRIQTKQGKEKWLWEQGRAILDKNGNPSLLEGLIIDISDRKSAEIALGEREAHYRALVSAIPDLIMRANRDGIHLDWAASSETRVLGDIDKFEGKHVTELVPQEQAQQRLQAIQRALEAQSTQVYEQTLMIEGEKQQEEVRVVPYAEDEVLLLVRDISDRKRAEEAALQKSHDLEKALDDLQNAQLQLVQNEKMSALGGLVAGVAHEINNPVGCIIGNVGATKEYINDLLGLLDFYAQELPEPSPELEEELDAVDLDYVREDLPKLIRAMKDSGERIKSISRSLRTFSRTDTDNKQPFSLHEGIESTGLILRHRLKANDKRPAIEVHTDYGDIPEIACFPGQLNQVFMNILANAIDALDEASQDRSFSDIQENPNRIIIQTKLDNQQVKIVISDNGPGIPDAIKDKIFDNLFTTKGVGKGTGLGLAIVRQIVVDTHGGTLDVHSELGHGTEFCIRLPIN